MNYLVCRKIISTDHETEMSCGMTHKQHILLLNTILFEFCYLHIDVFVNIIKCIDHKILI